MTLKHLRIFGEVYRTENVTRAAENLYMTQPAVSRAIAELEAYYNVRLFERFRHRLAVTDAGRNLYVKSTQILATMDELERNLKDGDASGILRVGSNITIGNFLLPEIAGDFQAAYPSIRLEITIGNGERLTSMLLENELDLSFIEREVTNENFRYEAFGEDILVAVQSRGRPTFSKKEISLKELCSSPLLLREQGSSVRSCFDRVLESRELHVKPLWESSSTEALLSACEEGLGVAILPLKMCEQAIVDKRVTRLFVGKQQWMRNCYIVYHKDKYMTPAMQRFIQIAKAKRNEYDYKLNSNTPQKEDKAYGK